MNYLFGLALAFLFAAFWLRASPNGSRRAAIAMCGVVVLFFCHIFAAATFLVLIGSFEIGPLLTGRHGSFGALLRGSSSILAGMLAVLLFLISALSTPLVAAPESTAAVYPASVGGFALEKLKLLIKPVLDGNGLAAIATVLGFAGVLLLAWRSRIRWSGPVLLIIAVMGVVAMVTPISLFADGKLDYRFALVPIFVGLAGLQITWRSDRLRQLAVLLLTVTVLARTVLLTVAYAEDNKVYRALEDATKALPPGSILLTGFGLKEDQLSWWDIWAPPATHLATRAVVEGVLVPDVFAVPAQQPLAWLGVRGPDTANPFDTITKESFYIGDKSSLQSVMTGLSGACRDLVQGPVPHHLFLLVLYPSAVTQANLQPQSIVASNPKFQLVDLCRWQH